MNSRRLHTLMLAVFLSACATAKPVPTATPTVTSIPPSPTWTETASVTPTPVFTPTITPTPTLDLRPKPREWSSWPIVPALSPHVLQIYQAGLKLGVTPHTFSVVGDCQSANNVFMGIYGTERNPITKDANLVQTIGLFKDSFQHQSQAVRDGLSAPSALDPLWADPKSCNPTESPVACELRLYKPEIVFINLGTNWKAGASADAYEGYLRKIVDQILAAGAIPILTNKADNVEGDHSINLATAKVAYDYDIPLINFWLASDSLPGHGLDPNRNDVYLTPEAWDVRSYEALKTLDKLWRYLQTALSQ
jgi:hypothetical protein